jgi:acyl carrier protein
MSTDVKNKILSIVEDLSGCDQAEIKPDTNFLKDLGMDSIKAIEFTVAIEKEFNISVRDDDVPKITTVNQAVELVNILLTQRPTIKC